MKYKHIIWDWNGTLFNDAWLCLEVINSMLAERDLNTQTLEDYRKNFDFPIIKYYQHLGFDFEKEAFEIVGAEFIKRYETKRDECDLFEQTREVLQQLSQTVEAQHILSAYVQQSLEEVVKKYELAHFFSKLSGHHDIYAPGKRESGILLVNDLKISPESILLIGDTVHDYEVACAIDASCLLVDHGHHQRERLEACGVPIVSSMKEIIAWINTA